MTVEQAAATTCSTSSVEGLCRDIIAEALRREPDLLAEVTHPRIKPKYQHVYLLLQPYAAESLARVVNRRKTAVLRVASCLRVLPAQYLLYRYYRTGRCGIQLAAPPGASNHEKGSAVDVESPESWKLAFQAEGWRWLGPKDKPHFDRVSGRADVDNRMCAAFQRLWNTNHPKAKIAEDGDFGPRTEAALKKAPAEGWPTGQGQAWKSIINGTDQTEVVGAFFDRVGVTGEKDTTWIKVRGQCDYYGFPPPAADFATNTVSWVTDKTTCQAFHHGEPCEEPSARKVTLELTEGTGVSQWLCMKHLDELDEFIL